MICLSITLLLGASFLAIKGYEYSAKVKSGIHPVPGQRQVFDVAEQAFEVLGKLAPQSVRNVMEAPNRIVDFSPDMKGILDGFSAFMY